ncbi:hypothetical protein ACOSP7_012303 [Xanthoceras sorbifolium]
MHRHFSVKSNVFSFGVLVLELVSGQKRSCLDTEEEIECLLAPIYHNSGSSESDRSGIATALLRENEASIIELYPQ